MKKVLFFLSLLFLSLITAKGQTNVYHPFPDSNAIWNVLEFYYTDYVHSDSMQKNTFHFGMFGDTIIGLYSYNKIFYNSGLTDSTIQISSLNTHYYGGLREDEPTKKTYFLFKDSINEKLIYDFNMNPGDTITIRSYWGDHDLLCMGKDSIFIGNHYRSIYNLWSNYTMVGDFWIEGIGSTKGLLFSYNYNILANPRNALLCFTENDTTLFHIHDYTIGYPISNISLYTGCYYQGNYITNTSYNFRTVEKKISVNPNPFSQSTQITLNQSYHSISLAVYDIQGKQVAQQQYADCDKIQFSRNQLSNGLYFLKLTLDDKEVETGKIVISE